MASPEMIEEAKVYAELAKSEAILASGTINNGSTWAQHVHKHEILMRRALETLGEDDNILNELCPSEQT